MNEIAKGYGTVETNDNVLDLQKDEKLKLQLEIRKMASDLKKEVTDPKKTAAISSLDTHFNDLLHKGTIERSELNNIKEDIINKYTTAKISNPSGTDSADDNAKEKMLCTVDCPFCGGRKMCGTQALQQHKAISPENKIV